MPKPKDTTTSKSTAATTTRSTRSSTAVSAVRTVGPAIPLAIALLGSAVLPGGKTTAPGTPTGPITSTEAQKCGGDISDFRACHDMYPTGCTITGSSYDPYLNELKNQIKWGTLSPAAMQPKEIITSLDQLNQLESQLLKPPLGLTQKNHGDLSAKLAEIGEGSIYGTVGFLYAVEPEGAESSNCQLAKDPPDFQDVDYHIFIGYDPAVAEKLRSGTAITSAEKHQSMVVEMTPHYRDAFHQEWTVAAVKAVLGQQVKVLGQLMVDNEHFVAGQDCGVDPTKPRCWRASVWELHPVIDFRACPPDGKCDPNSSAGWTPIGEGPQNASSEAPAKGPVKGKP